MKVLIIDNFDSFTYNLYQYVGEILQKKFSSSNFVVDVVRNNEITIEEIRNKKYNRIIISPGPGSPENPAYFGVCADVLTVLGMETPVLGVCLGMQGMAYYFGGKIIRAKKPMHGKTSRIQHDGKGVFANLPQDLEVMRYHSLIADASSLPKVLEITAIVLNSNERSNIKGHISNTKPEDIEIMGLRHKKYPIEGIQFHPESFATEGGKKMLENWIMANSLY
jgi:anthranilate synthase/aminodeoxychorismate synthase-like glutamine amidotransferase